MGNCLERPKVTAAWYDDDNWGLPLAERSGEARSTAAMGNGGMKLKIRMTKGQLRRFLESVGHGGGPTDKDLVAEVMSMGVVRVELVAPAGHQQAAEMHHKPPKLETIQEDDFDE